LEIGGTPLPPHMAIERTPAKLYVGASGFSYPTWKQDLTLSIAKRNIG